MRHHIEQAGAQAQPDIELEQLPDAAVEVAQQHVEDRRGGFVGVELDQPAEGGILHLGVLVRQRGDQRLNGARVVGRAELLRRLVAHRRIGMS